MVAIIFALIPSEALNASARLGTSCIQTVKNAKVRHGQGQKFSILIVDQCGSNMDFLHELLLGLYTIKTGVSLYFFTCAEKSFMTTTFIYIYI